MAKQNYGYEKRQKELKRQQKQAEKRQRRLERREMPARGEDVDVDATTTTDVSPPMDVRLGK